MKNTRSAQSISTARRSANTAQMAQETMGAAASVIAARTMDMANPTADTAAEMNLMVSEKIAAFTEAGAAMTAGATTMANQGARYAADEATAANRGFSQLAACRTPLEMLMVQGRLVSDFFGRSVAYGMGLNALVARTGDKALAPVHKTVTANHKRLKGK
jgi:hypothetical protein